jgi:hypothetical protein
VDLLALPGTNTVSSAFLAGLVAMATRHGWDPNGIALVISEESRFNPAAKNPYGTASGLLQFIESTAQKLGTTTAQIRGMSAEEQLPLVERYYEMTMRRTPTRLEDYVFPPLGRADLIGAPDSTTIFSQGSQEYDANPGLDVNSDGVITVGDVRSHMRSVLNQAKGVIRVTDRASPQISSLLVGVAVLGMTAAAGYAAQHLSDY